MPRVTLQFSLELSSPHEKVVYDLLGSIPEAQRREFLISAALYYSRSPSYLTETKMSEMLKKMEELSFMFTDPAYQSLVRKMDGLADTQGKLIGTVAEEVADVIERKLDGLDLSAAKSKKGSKKASTSEAPAEVVDALMAEFGT